MNLTLRPLPAVLLVAGIAAATVAAGVLLPAEPLPQADDLVIAEVVRPFEPTGVAFLFSGTDGWGLAEQIEARGLAAGGAIVVGVDLKKTFAKAEAGAADGECVYFVSDVESVSQQLQRSAGGSLYRDPIVLGAGVGGTMALAVAAQTPDATVGRTIAVDPGAVLPLERELCSGGAHRRHPNGGWTYGMQEGPLPDPVTVVRTPAAPEDGVAHVDDIVRAGYALNLTTSERAASAALVEAGRAALAGAGGADGRPLADLPLTVLKAKPAYDTMAIVLSGDGGWRDIDRDLANVLAEKGVPTIGLDSLRYFWSEKKPATVAADLGRIVDTYTKLWKVRQVVLIGYSFGADALPAAYLQMAPETTAKVKLVSLLALAPTSDFEIKVGGWVGFQGDGDLTAPDIAKMPSGLVQCIYGSDDDETACPTLSPDHVELVKLEGGHHFDGAYDVLADPILARLKPKPAG